MWGGEQFVFRESEGGGVFTALKLLDRYGSSDLKTFKNVVTDTTLKFDQIYALQNSGMFFETPAELWDKLGLKDLTQKTFEEEMSVRFSPNGIPLLQEMLFAVNKVNYNQSNSINALAGMG